MKKVFSLFMMLFIFMLSIFTVPVKAEENVLTNIQQFHAAVLQNGGYINMNIEVSEGKDNAYTMKLYMKENIMGVKLGFYATPSVLKILDQQKIQYKSSVDGMFMYTIAEANFNSIDDVSTAVSNLPFITMAGKDKNIYAEANLNLWNNERKDKLVDEIYKTNKIAFSLKPKKVMQTNADNFKDGTYNWILKDKDITKIAAVSKGSNVLGYIIFFSIIGIGTILLIYFKPWKYIKKRSNRNDYDDYNNGYGNEQYNNYNQDNNQNNYNDYDNYYYQ